MMFERGPWYIAGPLLGLVILGLRVTLNKPLGALGGYIDLAENASRPTRLGFRAFVLLGFVVGGFAYTVAAGRFSPELTYGTAGGLLPAAPAGQLALLLIAGIVMGFGARSAGGCTSGHGMSGMSLGSPASIAASMTFFATAVALAHGFALVIGGKP
ncbi:MAG: YeeE/YedE family protein [Deltaproteobacteria bacterium]|nr:YeeE/YedE family protein [Deltaproteobacteria bacterium]